MTREIIIMAQLSGAAQTIDKLITALQQQRAAIQQQIDELKGA